MKKILLVLYFLPLFAMAQQTYVPDDNFEQLLILQGHDNVLDDYVLTSNINQITNLQIANSNISDLTGIEDFISLGYLYCEGNQLSTLDVSNLHYLDTLLCGNNLLTDLYFPDSIKFLEFPDNQLAVLDISANIFLKELNCRENPITNLTLNDTSLLNLDCRNTLLTTIDLSSNSNIEFANINNSNLSSINLNGATNLHFLSTSNNQLLSLDISTNINLEYLIAENNNLSSLDLRNGNNTELALGVKQNPNLTCISVDDTTWANANWTTNNNIDQHHYFSNNCNSTNIEEVKKGKQLRKIVDVLGRETPHKNNTPLFYLYDDGTVEKRIIIE